MYLVRHFLPVLSFALLTGVCLSQDAANPWSASDIVEAPALAQEIQSAKPPVIFAVAFQELYRSKHILHAIDGGTASKPEGLAILKTAVANLAKDADIVIYCGCCPMVKCPNIRPAYRTLKELGFTRVRVLNIPQNMSVDWYTKNYPSEPGSASQKK